jgi:hypothetical protein
MQKVINLGIAAIVAAVFVPAALQQLIAANLTGASGVITAIWGVLEIIIIIAVMLIFIKAATED